MARNGGYKGILNSSTLFNATGRWGVKEAYSAIKDFSWPGTKLEVQYLLVGGGGGPGGYDGATVPGTGGSGGGVTGTYLYDPNEQLFLSVGGGGSQGADAATGSGGGAGGSSTNSTFSGGTGGNAGGSGSSGAGGGGGAGTALLIGNVSGTIIAVAGGGGGGGGGGEGAQDTALSGGGGSQPAGANGTNLVGGNGTNFSGDGGGGGGGGGGRYGGTGQTANTANPSSGGNNYNNPSLTNSASTFTGTAGLGNVTTIPAGTTITNASTWGYDNSAGRGGAGNVNATTGIAIIKYLGPQFLIGGTVSSVGGYTVHTFNADGLLFKAQG